MADYKSIKNIVDGIHEFNFARKKEEGIIKRNNFDKENWSFNNVTDSTGSFKPDYKVLDFCQECKKYGVCSEYENQYKDYEFHYITQGAHTFDFLEANEGPEKKAEDIINKWDKEANDTPVIFLMENPSVGYQNYEEIETKGIKRRVPQNWYWIHEKGKLYDNNDKFQHYKSGRYGKMIASLIYNNKLANAYLTNAVKCGISFGNMDVKEEKYIGTDKYADEIKKNCMEKVFKKEVEIIAEGSERLVVFAFGGNAYWMAYNFFTCSYENEKQLNIQLVQLPHPAGRIRDSYRECILKNFVNDVLQDKGIGHIAKGMTGYSEKELGEEIQKYYKDLELQLKLEVQLKNEGKKNEFKENKLAIYFLKDQDFFDNEKTIIKEIKVTTKIDNERVGFGYNFYTCEYWVWNYEKKDYISTISGSLEQYVQIFSECIEEIMRRQQAEMQYRGRNCEGRH